MSFFSPSSRRASSRHASARRLPARPLALLTPVATPVNLMVMGPGGYRFGDYWKLGLPILGLFFVISVFLVPVFWPF